MRIEFMQAVRAAAAAAAAACVKIDGNTSNPQLLLATIHKGKKQAVLS